MTAPDCFTLFLGFAGLVTVASLWNMWSGEVFPAEKDPTGGMYPCDSLQAAEAPSPMSALARSDFLKLRPDRTADLIRRARILDGHGAEALVEAGMDWVPLLPFHSYQRVNCLPFIFAAKSYRRLEDDQRATSGTSQSEHEAEDELMIQCQSRKLRWEGREEVRSKS